MRVCVRPLYPECSQSGAGCDRSAAGLRTLPCCAPCLPSLSSPGHLSHPGPRPTPRGETLESCWTCTLAVSDAGVSALGAHALGRRGRLVDARARKQGLNTHHACTISRKVVCWTAGALRGPHLSGPYLARGWGSRWHWEPCRRWSVYGSARKLSCTRYLAS